MKAIGLAVAVLILFATPVRAQTKPKPCGMLDNPSAVCQLPLLSTHELNQGYLSARGKWDGDIYPKNSEMEITCIKSQLPQVSNSSVGFCLMALGFTLDAMPGAVGVSTDYYDIVSWDKTRIVAEKTFHEICPESRQLVINFVSGTVVMTSTVSLTQACTAMLKDINKKLEPVTVYSMKHAPFTLYADEGMNPYLAK
jgi:hypothetical protein